MPTRKQRRRREKTFRHEWEYVEVDPETGEEHPVDPAELRPEKPERAEQKPVQKGRQQPQKRGGRATRQPPPPSWSRVLKRTALFAPVFVVLLYWTSSNGSKQTSALSIAVSTVVLVAFFAPFSYLIDTMTYRMWLKRSGQQPAAKSPRPSGKRDGRSKR